MGLIHTFAIYWGHHKREHYLAWGTPFCYSPLDWQLSHRFLDQDTKSRGYLFSHSRLQHYQARLRLPSMPLEKPVQSRREKMKQKRFRKIKARARVRYLVNKQVYVDVSNNRLFFSNGCISRMYMNVTRWRWFGKLYVEHDIRTTVSRKCNNRERQIVFQNPGAWYDLFSPHPIIIYDAICSQTSQIAIYWGLGVWHK